MDNKIITFDEVFGIWFASEANQIEGRDILSVAKAKGFNSIAEWRISTALRLRMDTKQWNLEIIEDPQTILPNVIIGPYQGWSKFFNNRLTTTFAQALQIPKFFEWCKTHDRIIPLSQQFPLPTTMILFRKSNGDLIHVDGGHRMCAVAYAQKMDTPINFPLTTPVTAAIAAITDEEIPKLQAFLQAGTNK